MKKKVLCLVIAISLIISAFVIPVHANTDVTDKTEQKLYTVLDKIANAAVGGIAALIATPRWANAKTYKSENFYPGNTPEEFKEESSDDAVWKIGYANASLLKGNEVGTCYVGGSLKVTKKLATKQYDDQKVRVIAVSDGGKINIFACLDAYGLANSDVRGIRAQFAEYAKENSLDINTVNVSVLHQHSCVDTFGMNGDIINALFTSSFKNLFGIKTESGQNPEYMENLYNVTVDCMKKAVENMTEGELYYGSADVSQYIRDKRLPEVFEGEMTRFRFVPADDSLKEIWICNCGIHCVGNGAGGTELTGDYPLYMEKYINENYNADFFYLEGAELALTSKGDDITPDPEVVEQVGDEGFATVIKYGETLAQKIAGIENETAVKPRIRVAFTETMVDIDNNILVLAAKGGLLVNTVVKDGLFKYKIPTEVGYAEFGDSIAVAIIPGELAPEIAYGGADTAETSWYGEDWEYDSFESLAPGKKLLVFGLTNDQIGYLITSNNWHSFFTENEEIVSTGRYAGEKITQEYIALFNKCTAA